VTEPTRRLDGETTVHLVYAGKRRLPAPAVEAVLQYLRQEQLGVVVTLPWAPRKLPGLVEQGGDGG